MFGQIFTLTWVLCTVSPFELFVLVNMKVG